MSADAQGGPIFAVDQSPLLGKTEVLVDNVRLKPAAPVTVSDADRMVDELSSLRARVYRLAVDDRPSSGQSLALQVLLDALVAATSAARLVRQVTS